MNPVAIADSGASHVILPTTALPEKKSGKLVTLRLAAGQVQAVEHQCEIFADHVTVPLCPLGRVIHKLGLTAIWTPKNLTLTCLNSSGTAHGLMQCPVRGDTPYFTNIQFWMLRRALQDHRQGQKTFPPKYWKQLYTLGIREGPKLRMAKSTDKVKPVKPDMKKCSLPQLGSYMTKTFLSQGLHQMVEQSTRSMSKTTSLSVKPLSSCVLGLHPPHSVVNVDASRHEWLSLHLLATHRPAHLQHDYTTIILQIGDVMPIQVIPEMWESATMIMLGKYKNGEIWSEGSGTTPCPSTCLNDKYKVTAGHLIPADNQFVALSPSHKYAIVPAKGDRIVVTYVLLKPEHVAAYQHALLTKHDFPVTPFAFPTRKRLVKKGPDPFEEDQDMKELRLSGEQLTDMSSRPPTRSAEEWEKHERNGHLPKFPDCPVCLEEQGPVVRHYAQNAPSLHTIHLDMGYWGDWSLDEKRYFIAAALRVEHDKSGILIPFFVPVENKSASCLQPCRFPRQVFALIDWISRIRRVSRFKPLMVPRSLVF